MSCQNLFKLLFRPSSLRQDEAERFVSAFSFSLMKYYTRNRKFTHHYVDGSWFTCYKNFPHSLTLLIAGITPLHQVWLVLLGVATDFGGLTSESVSGVDAAWGSRCRWPADYPVDSICGPKKKIQTSINSQNGPSVKFPGCGTGNMLAHGDKKTIAHSHTQWAH